MSQRQQQNGQMMNLLFTMLLFLVFVLCALFTVLIGGRVYENINSRIEENYSVQVVLNYVANKVRQSDVADSVAVREIEGTPVLELSKEVGGNQYLTWIYCRDGMVRELFTRADSGLGLADGLEIIECDGLTFRQNGPLLEVETAGTGLLLTIRSGGMENGK